MNVEGWEGQQAVVLTAMLAKRPLLIIGPPGTGKTDIVEVISLSAIGSEDRSLFIAYDAPNLQFDDLCGIVNIREVEKSGQMDFVKSPLTVWKKQGVSLDEIGAANPMLASKYLSLTLKRTVHGMPTDVKWVFSTMNGVGGTYRNHFLTPQLAERYCTFKAPVVRRKNYERRLQADLSFAAIFSQAESLIASGKFNTLAQALVQRVTRAFDSINGANGVPESKEWANKFKQADNSSKLYFSPRAEVLCYEQIRALDALQSMKLDVTVDDYVSVIFGCCYQAHSITEDSLTAQEIEMFRKMLRQAVVEGMSQREAAEITTMAEVLKRISAGELTNELDLTDAIKKVAGKATVVELQTAYKHPLMPGACKPMITQYLIGKMPLAGIRDVASLRATLNR
jgi:DNA-binding protein YbaB